MPRSPVISEKQNKSWSSVLKGWNLPNLLPRFTGVPKGPFVRRTIVASSSTDVCEHFFLPATFPILGKKKKPPFTPLASRKGGGGSDSRMYIQMTVDTLEVAIPDRYGSSFQPAPRFRTRSKT